MVLTAPNLEFAMQIADLAVHDEDEECDRLANALIATLDATDEDDLSYERLVMFWQTRLL